MADSTVTQTGVAETRALVDALPERVTAELRRTAERTANKIQASARANLYQETRSDKTPGTWAEATAAAITVTVDEPNKVVTVTSVNASGDPSNNPIWLEHGTIHEAPKPYMLPAAKEHEGQYTDDCQAALDGIAGDFA
jgi:hypothetical protein